MLSDACVASLSNFSFIFRGYVVSQEGISKDGDRMDGSPVNS
jgi:hypothetical protein